MLNLLNLKTRIAVFSLVLIGSTIWTSNNLYAETDKNTAKQVKTENTTPTQPRHYPVGRTPIAIEDNKYPAHFYPNTEKLGENEMRVTALGTGMPSLTKDQASASFMVELGNGDVFIFDVGTGSQPNLAALRPDWSKVDKAFVSHLHTDHVGDMDTLLIGGWLSGRYTPLHIYGPSGAKPELGTASFAKYLQKTYAWDISHRSGALPDAGGEVIVHEHDYKKVGVIYEQNGVKVISYPQIHGLDGSVGYRLEWNALVFVFGGDSVPSKWFLEQAKGADIAIHECFFTPEALVKLFGWDKAHATWVSSWIHTPPEGFGRLMDAIQPRLAVAYHVWLPHELHREQVEAIRKVYDGPLTMADDLVVWNITKDHIEVRKAVVSGLAIPSGVTEGYNKAEKKSERSTTSKFIKDGQWEGYEFPPLPEK